MRRRRAFTLIELLVMIAIGAVSAPALAQSNDKKPSSKPTKTTPTYPLKKSANGRYLVDQKNAPFLIAGDSPQALMVNLSEKDAEMYFANRKSHGFNAVWINLLCKPGTGGRKEGSTFDGIRPFNSSDDLSTPNDAYFVRCDRMIELAAKHGLLVILDPCETIDHVKMMVQNGATKCRDYGRYLGSRYKSFDNILWMSGNDLQSWKDAKVDAVATAVALGIKDKDLPLPAVTASGSAACRSWVTTSMPRALSSGSTRPKPPASGPSLPSSSSSAACARCSAS